MADNPLDEYTCHKCKRNKACVTLNNPECMHIVLCKSCANTITKYKCPCGKSTLQKSFIVGRFYVPVNAQSTAKKTANSTSLYESASMLPQVNSGKKSDRPHEIPATIYSPVSELAPSVKPLATVSKLAPSVNTATDNLPLSQNIPELENDESENDDIISMSERPLKVGLPLNDLTDEYDNESNIPSIENIFLRDLFKSLRNDDDASRKDKEDSESELLYQTGEALQSSQYPFPPQASLFADSDVNPIVSVGNSGTESFVPQDTRQPTSQMGDAAYTERMLQSLFPGSRQGSTARDSTATNVYGTSDAIRSDNFDPDLYLVYSSDSQRDTYQSERNDTASPYNRFESFDDVAINYDNEIVRDFQDNPNTEYNDFDTSADSSTSKASYIKYAETIEKERAHVKKSIVSLIAILDELHEKPNSESKDNQMREIQNELNVLLDKSQETFDVNQKFYDLNSVFYALETQVTKSMDTEYNTSGKITELQGKKYILTPTPYGIARLGNSCHLLAAVQCILTICRFVKFPIEFTIHGPMLAIINANCNGASSNLDYINDIIYELDQVYDKDSPQRNYKYYLGNQSITETLESIKSKLLRTYHDEARFVENSLIQQVFKKYEEYDTGKHYKTAAVFHIQDFFTATTEIDPREYCRTSIREIAQSAIRFRENNIDTIRVPYPNTETMIINLDMVTFSEDYNYSEEETTHLIVYDENIQGKLFILVGVVLTTNNIKNSPNATTHYYNYSFCPSDKKWYCINDDTKYVLCNEGELRKCVGDKVISLLVYVEMEIYNQAKRFHNPVRRR